jgi:hypothetical protein
LRFIDGFLREEKDLLCLWENVFRGRKDLISRWDHVLNAGKDFFIDKEHGRRHGEDLFDAKKIVLMPEKIFWMPKTRVSETEKMFSAFEKILSATETIVLKPKKIFWLTMSMSAALEKIFSFANAMVLLSENVVSATQKILSDTGTMFSVKKKIFIITKKMHSFPSTNICGIENVSDCSTMIHDIGCCNSHQANSTWFRHWSDPGAEGEYEHSGNTQEQYSTDKAAMGKAQYTAL